jgi:hypothetical protein
LAANHERLVPMINYLGKLLFPRLPRDVQRRKINIILMVLLVSLLLGGFIAFMLVFRNKMGVP